MYQPRPTEWDGQERVRIISVSPRPTSERSDGTGNAMYSWTLSGTPGSGESASFEVKFLLTAYTTSTDVSPDAVTQYNTTSRLFRQFTAPERFIESSDPAIKRTAIQLAADDTNPLIQARKFYDFVIDQSTYLRTGTGLHGAKALLKSGKGECGDYAALFVALARAAGIPARPIVGYWAASGLDNTHVWAEFYLQGIGWVPVDPTVGQSSGDQDSYFGGMDNRRVILNKGFNITLQPPAPDRYVAPFLQVPVWWFWGSGDPARVEVDRDAWIVKEVSNGD